MTSDQMDRADIELLNQRPEFNRFLLRVIQMAGIFQRTTDGSGTRLPGYDEGRRNLGLEILEMAEAHQPQGPVLADIPVVTLTQVLLEEARKPQPEKPNARRQDRYAREDEPDEA